MKEVHLFLQTLVLVLCAAAVTTVLFQRLKQPVVLGYLLAGMIVGPYVPIPLEANPRYVEMLAELGVILLMFSLGIEFSLKKLARIGPTAGFIALVQCSLLIWLGFLAGQAFGWTRLESLYAGAMISISSTTIIMKVFEEQRLKDDFTEVVFGVLIAEDLLAILLITILTTLSAGQDPTAAEVLQTAGRLAGFLVGSVVIGLLTVPRLMRAVVALDRPETTVVATVGLAFAFAYLALLFEYSVALGAFIAGSLVSESGVERKIEHAVQPVRDIFAAIFFVSVGMLIDPALIAEFWQAVLVFLVVVLVGNIVGVTVGAFLTGQSIQTSLKASMSLAQIGEFSFIIAGVAMATDPSREFLFSIAVAVSGVTALLTPWLIRIAEPVAAFVDRKLPRPLQTFVALYGSWLERLRASAKEHRNVSTIRRLVGWLAIDAVVVAAIVIGASVEIDRVADFIKRQLGLSDTFARLAVIAGAVVLSSPFWIGMVRVSRLLGWELASRTFPASNPQQADAADAPRRLLVVTLQLAIVVLVGAPLVAITQPFVPPLQGAVILVLLLALLAFSFWRNATNLQGHTRAAALILAEALAQKTRDARVAVEQQPSAQLDRMLVGLGSPEGVEIPADSPVAGKTLAAINLRGLTGATVLAVRRGGDTVLVPAGRDQLLAGDIVALAGTREAIEAAKELLLGQARVNEISQAKETW
jgi:CPA2 family monovalent cation:H+ antiporter-2